MTKRQLTIILATFLTLSACGGAEQVVQTAPERDLLTVLKTRPSLTKFTEALEATGVAATLKASGNYTVFAPIDIAVADTTLDEETVRHHILLERVTFSDIAGEDASYLTLHSDEIEIDATEAIRVGNGLMVESDIEASNGIIHVIDRVQPPGDAPTSLTPATDPIGLAPPTELPALTATQ